MIDRLFSSVKTPQVLILPDTPEEKKLKEDQL
jgi:hypothetical protein